MSEPRKNVYSKSMINNWVEERAAREAVIQRYLASKDEGNLQSVAIENSLKTTLKPTQITENKDIVDTQDRVLCVIHAEEFPLSITCDPRFPHYDARHGYICTLSSDISATARHVFQVVKVQDFSTSKMGKRLSSNVESASLKIQKQGELKQGDKFYLVADQEMMKKATGSDALYVLGCPRVIGAPVVPVIVAPLEELGQDAEFTVEDFQKAYRLEGQGLPVAYGQPMLLKHVASGQSISCNQGKLQRMPIESPHQEYQILCKTVLNEHKVEDQVNCFTFTCAK